MNRIEKGEGFPDQRIVVLPEKVVKQAQHHVLMSGLMPTDVGFFPRARGHLRARPRGAKQSILIYCANGLGWCEIQGRYHSVQSGDVLVIPPNIDHVYAADEGDPWSIHWLHAQGNLLDAFLRELDVTADRPVIRVGEDAQLFALFEELMGNLEHGYTTLQLIYASQTLAHLLAAMIRDHRGGHHEQPGGHQRIAQTITYMRQHLDKPMSLDAFAGVANLSRSRYTALFKVQTGYTPIDYFMRLRIHRACQLLDTTNQSVKVIAASVGYDDPLYFSRVFRSVTEVSPTEYRDRKKG